MCSRLQSSIVSALMTTLLSYSLDWILSRIWRWYSEETLEGMKQEYIEEGIDLANFSHITRHNNASIQTFYFPHDVEEDEELLDCPCDRAFLKCPKQ